MVLQVNKLGSKQRVFNSAERQDSMLGYLNRLWHSKQPMGMRFGFGWLLELRCDWR